MVFALKPEGGGPEELARYRPDSEPNCIGGRSQPINPYGSWIELRFSAWIEAWVALGKFFTIPAVAEKFEEVMRPYVNKPQDRVWDIKDPQQFCAGRCPPFPRFVDLDTSQKVFLAVQQLVDRRAWLENCQCAPNIPPCRSGYKLTISYRTAEGEEGVAIVESPSHCDGKQGGWYFVRGVDSFGRDGVGVHNLCDHDIDDGRLHDVFGVFGYPDGRILSVELEEIPCEGNQEGCRNCFVLPPPPPVPIKPVEIGGSPVGISFGEPGEGCTTVNIVIEGAEEEVKPAEVQRLVYRSGRPEVESVQVLVPSGKDGDTSGLFQLILRELASVKQAVHDRTRLNFNFYEGGYLVSSQASSEESGVEVVIPMPAASPRAYRLELLNVPEVSTRGIRLHEGSPVRNPEVRGQFGWYSWGYQGGWQGSREEVWNSKQVLIRPDGVGDFSLVLRLKSGLGYNLFAESASYKILGELEQWP